MSAHTQTEKMVVILYQTNIGLPQVVFVTRVFISYQTYKNIKLSWCILFY